MGRDDHKGKSNNSKALPQTPKNQKIQPGDMQEEIAKEFAELRKHRREKGKVSNPNRKQ